MTRQGRALAFERSLLWLLVMYTHTNCAGGEAGLWALWPLPGEVGGAWCSGLDITRLDCPPV